MEVRISPLEVPVVMAEMAVALLLEAYLVSLLAEAV
jgi:hypothetical protein